MIEIKSMKGSGMRGFPSLRDHGVKDLHKQKKGTVRLFPFSIGWEGRGSGRQLSPNIE